jgi:hypothetical protein
MEALGRFLLVNVLAREPEAAVSTTSTSAYGPGARQIVTGQPLLAGRL